MSNTQIAWDHATIAALNNPPEEVFTAMAAERAAQLRRNGHGEYGFRDLWVAGVRKLLEDRQ
jgi:hypothetical protein